LKELTTHFFLLNLDIFHSLFTAGSNASLADSACPSDALVAVGACAIGWRGSDKWIEE
jgi:hypothetical protein